MLAAMSLRAGQPPKRLQQDGDDNITDVMENAKKGGTLKEDSNGDKM